MSKTRKKLLLALILTICIDLIFSVILNPMVGFIVATLMLIAIAQRHGSRCRQCGSWNTKTKYVKKIYDNPSIVRYCKKCGHTSILSKIPL